MFNWETFWEEHPARTTNNIKWANLRTADYDYQKAYEHIDKSLAFEDTDSVLELGCGTGELTSITAQHVSFITGVDYSRSMINLAMKRYPSLLFMRAMGHILPFSDEKFDKIYLLGVIQHIPYQYFEPTIKELLRTVKKGGKILIGDVLEIAPKEAEVYEYPRDKFSQFAVSRFQVTKSYFEPEHRVDILLTK